MEKLHLYSLLLFCLFLLFYAGTAIKCYNCNSYFQADCADWFDNRTHNLQQCPDGYNMCRKIVQEVACKICEESEELWTTYFLDKWEVRYIRQCAKAGEVGGDEGRQCVDRYGSFNVKMRYCHCNNQEGCNSATRYNISVLLLILPVLTILGLFYSNLP